MTSSHDSFTLVSALSRALSHRIRTPLSTLSNELFCLKGTLSGEEWERLQRPVQRILDLLKELSGPWGKDNIPEACALVELIGAAGGDISLMVPKARLRFVVDSIARIAMTLASDQAVTPTVQRSADSVTISWQIPRPPQLPLDFSPVSTSLTGLLFCTLGLDELTPPLIDAVLEAEGWHVAVPSQGALMNLMLQIPTRLP